MPGDDRKGGEGWDGSRAIWSTYTAANASKNCVLHICGRGDNGAVRGDYIQSENETKGNQGFGPAQVGSRSQMDCDGEMPEADFVEGN